MWLIRFYVAAEIKQNVLFCFVSLPCNELFLVVIVGGYFFRFSLFHVFRYVANRFSQYT